MALSASAVVLALAPGAQAATANVCNQARTGHTGAYVATDGDPATPARHQSNLAVLGSNRGLVRAADRSPALSVCVIPTPTPGPSDPGSTFVPPVSIIAN